MNLADLRDIHLPDAVSWWPPATGWWLLVLLVIVIIVISRRIFKYIQNKPLNKLAIVEFRKIELSFQSHQDKTQLAQDISVLLRRICLSYKPRKEAASLTGKDWLEFLTNMTEDNYFSEQLGDIIFNAPYQKQSQFDSHELISSCKNWIEHLPRRTAG